MRGIERTKRRQIVGAKQHIRQNTGIVKPLDDLEMSQSQVMAMAAQVDLEVNGLYPFS